ncbi:MAG: phage tail protein [Rhodobacterales bacterium]|nr:phage tail protein [Rhodobacterales bacterium]
MAYPYTQFNFLLEIDGIVSAGFTEVSGVTMESDIVEYREGSDPTHVRKMPGLSKYGNITLKRGFTDNAELADWRKTVINGLTARKDGAIILLNEAGQPALRWEFTNAWPSKLEGAALNATANETAIETVELAVETVTPA